MPVIHQKVRTAKKAHMCDDCQRWRIHPGDPYTRLFGSADRGEKPYVIKVCQYCKDPDAPEPDGYDYIRSYYKVPVQVGMTVECEGRRGTVVPRGERPGEYISVRPDGSKRIEVWHPTWQTVYYKEDGTVAADYRRATPQAG